MHSRPHRLSSIIFIENDRGQLLLQHRCKRPNLGLWTCVGGKLQEELGESPFTCALRELHEETGLRAREADLQLFGILNETNYEGTDDWLMFLFRLKSPISSLPPACNEGDYRFFDPSELPALPLPPVDKDVLWPLFLENRPGTSVIHIDCQGSNHGPVRFEQGAPVKSLASLLASR